jgi:LysM repeat protein
MNFSQETNKINIVMNNPNPLVPQGSLLEQKAKGKSNLFIVVFTMLAIHVVFFAGLLMQGCGRKKPSENESAKIEATNSIASDTNFVSAPAILPPAGIDTNYFSQPPSNAPIAQANPIEAPAPVVPAETPAKVEEAGSAKEYKVAKGDLYYSIAKANGISISALKAANPAVDPKRLKVGMTLQIPAPAAAPAKGGTDAGATPSADTKSYTVKAGDTLTKIAKANGASVKDVRAVNNLKTDRLHVGQKLKLPAKSHAAAAATPAGTN